ncbi:MAG: ATP-binding protein [Deltaproteobacteria bacterium]|nr:ATP-binding protein [Deltaproteobacteria bacterium]
MSPDKIKKMVHLLEIHKVELKIQNEELKETQSQLSKSLDESNDLYDFSPNGYISIDQNGTILRANLPFCELVNIERNSLIGMHFSAFVFDNDNADQFYLYLKQIFHSKSHQVLELQLKSMDTSPFYVRLESIINKGLNSDLIQCLVAVSDISECKRAESLVLEAQKEANRVKSDFLANMSHEIRTPMNGIMGVASLLEKTKLTKNQSELVHIISSSSSTLLQIINDILDFSKIEADKLVFVNSVFNLQGCFEDLNSFFKKALEENADKLEFKINSSVPSYFKGDINRIKQILINLIGNAIKFTKNGEISVSVDVKSSENEQIELLFLVKDTGIGISEEFHENIFESFSQGHINKSMNYKGTGLGLAICKQLIQMMGGEIWLESQENQGASFYFTIKLNKANKPKEIIKRKYLKKNTDIPQIFSDQYPLKLMIAEDNIVNQMVAVKILESLGYEPTVVSNGKEVLKRLNKQKYDIIFMDIIMPIMGGIETTRKIIDSCDDQRPTIIAMTANAMIGDKEKYLSQGLDDYIAKPVMPDDLKNMIVKWGESVS